MRRLIHLLLAAGLLVGLLSGLSGTAIAQDEEPEFEFSGSFEHWAAFLPWVPNGTDHLDGIGPNYGAVTVQNIEHVAIEVDVYVGLGQEIDRDAEDPPPSDWALVHTLELSAHESMTLDAATLGIPEGVGAAVALAGWFDELPIELPFNDDVLDEDFEWPARIAASTKNVSPVPSNSGMTSESHVTVDGYSALTEGQIFSEDGTWVLPIAQNNSGWETMLRVAHFGEVFEFGDSPANITLTFYGSGEQGYAGRSWQTDVQVRPGGVASINLSSHVPDDFVGSVFIQSNANVGAVAERYKAETSMLLTNTSRPENYNFDTQYAPLVFKEYNYWNTGISVANTDPGQTNHVTITYYGPTQNVVGEDTLTIPPRGMEFVYTPGSQDLGLNQGLVGSARISGTTSFQASVDQVKYFGNDPDVGQAMSYVAEDEIAQMNEVPDIFPDDGVEEFAIGDTLALPLVQKGNPNTDNGDTSGIQLFNTSLTNDVRAEVTFYSANGLPVAPTVDDNEANPILVTLGASQSYTLYSHELSEMSSGFQGSATVEVVGGGGGLTGVSNNVNYEVQNDGSTAFNMVTVLPIYQILNNIIDQIEDELCGQFPELCEEGNLPE